MHIACVESSAYSVSTGLLINICKERKETFVDYSLALS